MAASYLASPRLSKEEEDREKASLTDEERLSVLSDLYGALPVPEDELSALRSVPACPPPTHVDVETEESVGRGLDELEKELAAALSSASVSADDGDSDGDSGGGGGGNSAYGAEYDAMHVSGASACASTAAYRRAQQACPDIVESREHRLLFLRYECFDAKPAAARMLRYWTDRVAIFGEGHAFGPLTLAAGAYDGDAVELAIGYPRLSPERDASGRALIIFNQSVIERGAYERKRMLRACWCTVHRALEDERVQKNGFVLMGLGYGQLDQLDRKLDTLLWRNVRDVLPARIVANHFIYGSNKHIYSMIAPNIKFFFGRLARARLREYTGSEAEALEELKRYGIAPSSMPSEIGGGWVYNNRWYEAEMSSVSSETSH